MAEFLVTLGGLPLYGESAGGVNWYIEEDGVDGWWGLPASTISPQQRSRANGAWAGDAWLSARNISISGIITAPTRSLALGALDLVKSAATLSATTLTIVEVGAMIDGAVSLGSVTVVDNGDGTITLSWPGSSSGTITIDAESEPLTAAVRRTDELLSEWINDTSVRFSIQFVAMDPRKVGTVRSGSTGLPSTSGGFTFPMTFPLTITATTVAGQVTLENPGTTTGKVTFRIDGPITGPVITHVNSGKSLTFASSIVIPAGDWIDVDMDARTVLQNGTASRSAWVTERGWSGFDLGTNVWAFSAASGTGTLTVNAWPSWM
jgi:hypothetical protein